MKHNYLWPVGAAVLFMAQSALAQTPQTILKQTFDDGTEGWNAIGVNGRVSLTQSSFNGKGALKYEYDVKKGAMGGCVYASENLQIEKAKTFRFWVNADYQTTLAVVLQEKGGARYAVPFTTSKNKWQKVECSVSDFMLMDNLGSPPDPNNQLDLDEVNAIGLADITQFIFQIGNDQVTKLLGVEPGTHILMLDDFTITDESLPGSYTVSPTGVRLDTFARPQMNWMTLGGITLTKIDGKQPGEKGLQADYKQAPGRIAALMRTAPRGKLKSFAKITFDASSAKTATLLVQLEEQGGGKFNTTVVLTEGGQMTPVEVEFDSLNPADDSSVKDRKLKPELISQILIADATGLLGGNGEQDNTLKIFNLKALPAK